MCMHVHARGEGKGREKERKGREGEKNIHRCAIFFALRCACSRIPQKLFSVDQKFRLSYFAAQRNFYLQSNTDGFSFVDTRKHKAASRIRKTLRFFCACSTALCQFHWRVERRQYNTRKGNRPGATLCALVETRHPHSGGN